MYTCMQLNYMAKFAVSILNWELPTEVITHERSEERANVIWSDDISGATAQGQQFIPIRADNRE